MGALLAVMLAATPAQAALARCAAMAGTWVATEEGKDSAATFEPLAKGTAVLQKSGFAAVYSLDGDAVLLTVWVDDGFSMRLRASGKNVSDKRLVFEPADMANAAAAEKSGAPERLEMEWLDATHVVQRWRWKLKGAEPFSFSVSLTRK